MELPLSISKNLNDKLYEKRKIGALEVETLVKELRAQGDQAKLKKTIQYLTDNYAYSSNGNSKKGGLIALAAVVIGLGKDSYRYIHMVIPPVLKCFSDQDHRIRYYACEALYNITKQAGPLVLQYFCEIFDNMCRLAADPEKTVQDGALLLNKLLQDVVRESDVFDLDRFVPLLERRIGHTHANVRQYLIGWVKLLDSVANLDMLEYLPNILDGLFFMLGDKHSDIVREVSSTLSGFLGEIKSRNDVEFGTLTRILVKHCTLSPDGIAPDEYTHYVALGWLHQFILAGRDKLIPFCSDLLSAILPSLSHDIDEIRDTGVLANDELLKLIGHTKELVPIDKMVEKILMQFLDPNAETRVAALNWVRILHAKNALALAPFFVDLFPALIKKIGDPSEKVVTFALEVMAKISLHEEYFTRLMSSLVEMFAADPALQSSRGALIIRQLSQFIDPAKIFTAIAKILLGHSDLAFCTTMIQTLSIILLTSRELRPLRDRLRALGKRQKDTVEFFVILYEAFSNNAVATISLCLLCELYEHTANLLVIVGGFEMTVDFLVEMDRLVQLIESPIFAYLRLQLLDPQEYPHLVKALYALLMILPQSTAFTTLQRRLACVTTGSQAQQHLAKRTESGGVLNMDELTKMFVRVQEEQLAFREALRAVRVKESQLENTRAGKKLLDSIRKKQEGIKL